MYASNPELGSHQKEKEGRTTDALVDGCPRRVFRLHKTLMNGIIWGSILHMRGRLEGCRVKVFVLVGYITVQGHCILPLSLAQNCFVWFGRSAHSRSARLRKAVVRKAGAQSWLCEVWGWACQADWLRSGHPNQLVVVSWRLLIDPFHD